MSEKTAVAIRQIMSELKLKQKDLAQVLGVTLNRVKSMTSGRVKNLTHEENEALSRKLCIRSDWLIAGEGSMFQGSEELKDERSLADARPSALAAVNSLMEWIFSPGRDPRSAAYIAGVRGMLLFKLCDKPLKNPHTPGTAEADAWWAGIEEGRTAIQMRLQALEDAQGLLS